MLPELTARLYEWPGPESPPLLVTKAPETEWYCTGLSFALEE